jgi:hydroxyacylglutathione hydrolase
MQEIIRFDSIVVYRAVLGMVRTNTYVAVDQTSSEAVVIDPADRGSWIVEQAQQHNWAITSVWFTHAHFDHIAGAAAISDALGEPVSTALHPGDLPLFQQLGGAELFGVAGIEIPGDPDLQLQHGLTLELGSSKFRVRHTPGHSPGHVIFVHEGQPFVFCGDLIFQGGVGRTDLPGGDWSALVKSIRSQVYSLPPDTLLLPGHGEPTTVREEQSENPYVQGVI